LREVDERTGMIFPNEFEMKLNRRKGLKLFNGTLHYRQVSRWNAA
jgi:hypothetical protein